MTLLEQYQDVFLVLHIIAMSIAIGSATVHDIAFYQQLKFFYSEKWNARIFKISKNLIFTSTFWILVSGLALFWPLKEDYSASPIFNLKLIVSLIVLLNSLILYQLVMPRVANSFKYSEGSKINTNAIRKLAFVMSGISLTSWYSIAALGALQQLNTEFITLLSFYLGLILFSIIIGLISEYQFSKRFRKRSAETLKEIAGNLLKDISARISALNQK